MNLEQARDLKHSQHWEWVKAELKIRVDSCVEKLKTCFPEDFRDLQMLIKGYEALMNLPQDVIDRES